MESVSTKYKEIALQVDPMVPEALQMFETMTAKEARHLAVSRLIWTDTVIDDCLVLRLPSVEMYFKYANFGRQHVVH